MLILLIQFLLGMLYANAGEWLMHRFILHGLGSRPRSFWAYHLADHHVVCHRNNMIDPGYGNICLTTWNTQSKELVVLAGIMLLHSPLWFISPALVSAVYVSLAIYYYKHRRAHLDTVWARQHLRWHYDHHLNGRTGGNWCVTWPWFDYLLGTRVKSS